MFKSDLSPSRNSYADYGQHLSFTLIRRPWHVYCKCVVQSVQGSLLKSISKIYSRSSLWKLISITQWRIDIDRSYLSYLAYNTVIDEYLSLSSLPFTSLGWELSFIIILFWGCSLDMSNRTHQASLCPCDTTCAWKWNHYSDLHSCSALTRQNRIRGITSVFRRAFGNLEGSPTNQVNAWEIRLYSLNLSASNLEDPLAVQLEWCR